MIKVHELRLGNWIMLPIGSTIEGERLIQVDAIDEIGINGSIGRHDSIEYDCTNNEAVPILLTAEWLERLGFEDFGGGTYGIDEMGFPIEVHSKTGLYVYGRDTYIKYVHQLQNLFFAIRGRELELKSNVEQ